MSKDIKAEDVFIEKVATKGRPRKVLTEEGAKVVEKLASIFCPEEDIAEILGVSIDTMHNEDNNELFRGAILRGKTNGKRSLRQTQFDIALRGNVKMLIWLGKQYLGQSDKVELDSKEADKEMTVKVEIPTQEDYERVKRLKEQCFKDD